MTNRQYFQSSNNLTASFIYIYEDILHIINYGRLQLMFRCCDRFEFRNKFQLWNFFFFYYEKYSILLRLCCCHRTAFVLTRVKHLLWKNQLIIFYSEFISWPHVLIFVFFCVCWFHSFNICLFSIDMADFR